MRTAAPAKVNNAFYDTLGDRWYQDDRHAIALLRAESKLKTAYVLAALSKHGFPAGSRILDVACGAGFVSLPLAAAGYTVEGIDLSGGSLQTARTRAAHLSNVEFREENALALSAGDATYAAVILLDFLEHIDQPALAIKEAVRVLQPGGLIVVHTFNRTLAARLLAIKALEWLTHDCPEHVHVFDLFLQPREVAAMLQAEGIAFDDVRGLRPAFGTKAFWKSVLQRRLDPQFSFVYTRSLAVGYVGHGVKTLPRDSGKMKCPPCRHSRNS